MQLSQGYQQPPGRTPVLKPSSNFNYKVLGHSFYGLYLAQSNDEDQDAYKGEAQKERSNSKIEISWKEFVKKMSDSTPDPVVSCH